MFALRCALAAGKPMKFVLFANTDWYLWNFRRSLVAALQERGHEVLLLSPDGEFGPKLRGMGVRWQPIRMERRSLNPFRELMLLLRLVCILRRERPSIVHSFTIKCAVYGSVAGRLAGVPVRINAVAGMGYVFTNDSWLARLLRPVVRVMFKVSLGGPGSRLILQNPDDVALFEKARLIPTSHISLIAGSGVDCTRFAPRVSAKSIEPVRVLLAARLLWDKGVGEYVEAAKSLRDKKCMPLEFLLAGTPDHGNPASVSQAAVHGWQEEGVLRWLGHVEDMPELFRNVDIVVLPSYREGLPKGLIEAAASGCALVATDVPGCRQVVEHEVDGLRVAAKSWAELARAIERLAIDPALRTRLGAAARKKALDRFDERIIIERTLETYRGTLRSRGSNFEAPPFPP